MSKKRVGEVLRDFRENNWDEIRKNNKKKRQKRFEKGSRKNVNQSLREFY